MAEARSGQMLLSAMIALSGAPGLAQPAAFGIVSDQKSTVTGAELCLAVDRAKPLVPDRGAPVVPPPVSKPFSISGTFYPVVSVRCDALTADIPSQWTLTDTRDIRIIVNGTPMCLSARFMTSFVPLLEPLLRAFKADEAGSPFAYLAGDLKPGGKVNADRLRANPDLVVSSCGRAEAADHWVFDDITGTISGPAGFDDKGQRRRQCVTMHGDWRVRPPKHDAGMPVSAANCPDLRSFTRSGIFAHQRWNVTAGKDALPTYRPPEPKDYFSGAGALPITGPMGRCLTADV